MRYRFDSFRASVNRRARPGPRHVRNSKSTALYRPTGRGLSAVTMSNPRPGIFRNSSGVWMFSRHCAWSTSGHANVVKPIKTAGCIL